MGSIASGNFRKAGTGVMGHFERMGFGQYFNCRTYRKIFKTLKLDFETSKNIVDERIKTIIQQHKEETKGYKQINELNFSLQTMIRNGHYQNIVKRFDSIQGRISREFYGLFRDDKYSFYFVPADFTTTKYKDVWVKKHRVQTQRVQTQRKTYLEKRTTQQGAKTVKIIRTELLQILTCIEKLREGKIMVDFEKMTVDGMEVGVYKNESGVVRYCIDYNGQRIDLSEYTNYIKNPYADRIGNTKKLTEKLR